MDIYFTHVSRYLDSFKRPGWKQKDQELSANTVDFISYSFAWWLLLKTVMWHHLYCVFVYIHPHLIKKDLCDFWNNCWVLQAKPMAMTVKNNDHGKACSLFIQTVIRLGQCCYGNGLEKVYSYLKVHLR